MGIGKKQYRAHRLAYEVWVGPIPPGLTIDHVRARGCTSTLCCNPEHLEPVTAVENILRGSGVMVLNSRKKQCKHGHDFDTVRKIPGGKLGRACSTCNRDRTRRHVQKKRQSKREDV